MFVAVALPRHVKDELARAIASLAPHLPRARFARPENLHVTLAFLGSTDDALIPALSASIAEGVDGMVDFTTRLDGIGAFPSAGRARVLWAGLEDAAGGFAALADAVASALEPHGWQREARPFRPHVTIARFRDPERLTDIDRPALDPSPFPVDRVTMFESRLHPKGARYEALATFPFRRRPGLPVDG